MSLCKIDLTAILAKKRDEQKAEHVVSSDSRSDDVDSPRPWMPVLPSVVDHCILREEAAEAGHAADREHRRKHDPEREGHPLPQAAHAANILLVCERVNH